MGSYRCTCREGFKLRGDNRTCERQHENVDDTTAQAAHRDRCYASCDTVHRLHDKLKVLQEKVTSLLKLKKSSFLQAHNKIKTLKGKPKNLYLFYVQFSSIFGIYLNNE